MEDILLLETDGFTFSFHVDRRRTDQEYVGMTVLFVLDPTLGSVSLRSEPTSISTKDLQDLVTYFEQHVAHLQQDAWSDAEMFVNTELGFQLQALAGELLSATEGDFGIRCTVNVVKSDEGRSRVYVGGEANVTVEQVQAFTGSIETLLTHLAPKSDRQ